MERTIERYKNTKVFYVYKENEGIKKYQGVKWIKDPERIIEQTFFKHHYPCGSFVVIGKNGDYQSYFGEYPVSYVLDAVRALNK